MPPSHDPFASPRAKLFDLFLCLLIVALIVLMVLTAPTHRHVRSGIEATPRSAELAVQ